MKRIGIVLIGIVMSMSMLIGCSEEKTPDVVVIQEDETSPEESTTDIVEVDEPELEVVEGVEEPIIEGQTYVYIGLDDNFKEYPVEVGAVDYTDSESLSAYLEALIDEIGVLTGWNLTCSIYSYKSVSVCFDEESTLFVGPPEPQVDEFFVYDEYQLVETILDSVEKTIQMNLVSDLGDPDTVEVYYATMEDTELMFPNLNMHVPLEEAYDGLIAVE